MVTVAALPACKKHTAPLSPPDAEPEPEITGSAYVFQERGLCWVDLPVACPKDVACNPPAPLEIDCPPNEGGDAAAAARRPPGKEGWLRVKPALWASQYGCSYQPERFCAPPGQPSKCTPYPETVKVPCARIPEEAGAPDAGRPSAAAATGRWALSAFTYKDGLGVCHEVPPMECDAQKKCEPPEGKVVPCP